MSDTKLLQMPIAPLLQNELIILDLLAKILSIDLLIPFVELTDQNPQKQNTEFFYPIIVQKEADKYLILDGFGRFCNALQNGEKTMVALVTTTHLSKQECASVRIILNCNRDRTVKEMVQITKWIDMQSDSKNNSHIFAKAKIARKEQGNYRRILQFPQATQELFFDNKLSIQVVDYFQVLTKEDQDFFLTFFEYLKPTVQLQREFLEWLAEIAHRDNTTAKEILSQDIFANIITSSRNEPQKLTAIRGSLYKIRFPMIVEAQKKFSAVVQKISRSNNDIKIVPDRNFERKRFELNLSVTTVEKLIDILNTLSNVKKTDWQTLIDPTSQK